MITNAITNRRLQIKEKSSQLPLYKANPEAYLVDKTPRFNNSSIMLIHSFINVILQILSK